MSGSGYNKCTFVGNLGKDPDLRRMPGGDAVLSFSVGANESWKTKDGEKKERCEWVNCSLFGTRAEALAKFLEKGSRVLVEGKLRTDKSEKGGETKYFTKLIVSEIVLLGDSKRSSNDSDDRPQQQARYGTSGHGGSAKHSAPAQQDFGDAADDGEIPF